jgi:hypothetical protein
MVVEGKEIRFSVGSARCLGRGFSRGACEGARRSRVWRLCGAGPRQIMGRADSGEAYFCGSVRLRPPLRPVPFVTLNKQGRTRLVARSVAARRSSGRRASVGGLPRRFAPRKKIGGPPVSSRVGRPPAVTKWPQQQRGTIRRRAQAVAHTDIHAFALGRMRNWV